MSYNNNLNIFDTKSTPTEFAMIANLDIKSITPFYTDITINNFADAEIYNNISEKLVFLVKDVKSYNAEGAGANLRAIKSIEGVLKIIFNSSISNSASLPSEYLSQQPILCTQFKWGANPTNASTILILSGYRIELN